MMALDLQPTLSDDLITLRPMQTEDWAALFGVVSDPLLTDREHTVTFKDRVIRHVIYAIDQADFERAALRNG